MVKWSCLFCVLFFFLVPLVVKAEPKIPSLYEKVLCVIAEKIEADNTLLSLYAEKIHFFHYTSFMRALSDVMRVNFFLYVKDHANNLTGANFKLNAIYDSWFDTPYKIRQEFIEQDLRHIKAAEIPCVDASQLNLSAEQFDRLIGFSFLEELNLSHSLSARNNDVDHVLRAGSILAPSTELSKLRMLNLKGCHLKIGFIHSWLRFLPALIELDGTENDFGQLVYTTLKDHGTLETLILKNCGLKRRHLDAIAEMTSLKKLDISKNNLNASQIESLEKMKYLHHLFLNDNKQLINNIDFLGEMNLVSLDLSGCPLQEHALSFLPKMQTLQNLQISKTPLSDQALDAILKLEGLTSLTLSSADLTLSNVQKLLTKKGLRTLDVSRNKLTFAAFEKVRFSGLTELDLSSNRLKDDGVNNLRHFPCLKHLNIQNCFLTDDAEMALKALSCLETLRVDRNKMSPQVMRRLNKGVPFGK